MNEGETHGSRFVLTIELGNEGMQSSEHVADRLRAVAGRLDLHGFADAWPAVLDLNGNTVGGWEVLAS